MFVFLPIQSPLNRHFQSGVPKYCYSAPKAAKTIKIEFLSDLFFRWAINMSKYAFNHLLKVTQESPGDGG